MMEHSPTAYGVLGRLVAGGRAPRHHVRRLAVSYLAGQVYLEPHPKELMLRNHV
jgi:uncharacterized protein YbgA (DUF1722 family)